MFSGAVNRVIHNEQAQIDSGVGDWCHYKEGWFPAFVVTDLQDNILLDNNPSIEADPQWKITGARVMTTRFWSASTAYISATVHLPDLGMYPPPPPRKLSYEHQFRIWAGHLNRPRQVRPEDLGTGNEEGRLLPIFLGSVDTYALHCTSEGGYTLTIQARDRMKWFMDTQITYNLPSEMDSEVGDLTRSDIIFGALARGLGEMDFVDGAFGDPCRQVCSMQLHAHEVSGSVDLGRQEEPQPADYFYSVENELSGSTALSDIRIDSEPVLRYYVTRKFPPGAALSDGMSIIFERKTPLEIVKQLAMQEVYPMEVFQDHRTGYVYYTPRANDVSALPTGYGGGRDAGGDSKRFFRTYFFRNYPERYLPDINQMLLAFKEEQSSLGMFTNFIVNKTSSTNNTADATLTVALAVRPWGLPNDMPCRFYTADDTTIDHIGEAGAVAVQLARIFAKETRAGVAVLLGDPSFVPGEVIQVIGSPNATSLESDEPIRSDADMVAIIDNERRLMHEHNGNYNRQLEEAYFDNQDSSERVLHFPAETDGDANSANPYTTVKGDQTDPQTILCSVSEETNRQHVRYAPRQPTTIWRVEGIMHKYSFGEGYTTELALAGAF